MLKKILFPVTGLLMFFGLICSCLVFTTSCRNETSTEVVHDTTVIHDTTGGVFICFIYSEGSWGELMSDPLADTASSEARIKWDTYDYVFPYEQLYNLYYLSFEDTSTHLTGKEYTIELTSNIGNCSGKAILPEASAIIQPDSEEILPFDSSVYCEWSSAAGADFYYVDYYADAYDSNGDWIDMCEWKAIYTTATSFTIPSSYFNIPDAAYYAGGLSASSCSGPLPQQDTSGNMSGSIKGFLSGQGDYEYIYFYVGTPASKRKLQIKRHTPQDKMKAYIKALGIEVE